MVRRVEGGTPEAQREESFYVVSPQFFLLFFASPAALFLRTFFFCAVYLSRFFFCNFHPSVALPPLLFLVHCVTLTYMANTEHWKELYEYKHNRSQAMWVHTDGEILCVDTLGADSEGVDFCGLPRAEVLKLVEALTGWLSEDYDIRTSEIDSWVRMVAAFMTGPDSETHE